MTDEPRRDEGSQDDEEGTEFTHDECHALEPHPDADDDSTADSEADTGERPEPLSDLAAAVTDDESSSTDTATLDDLFEHHDAADIDDDQLWDQLEGGDTTAPTGEPSQSADQDRREIDKRAYCHGCEYFAEPPTVACTRDGTAILSVPTIETFRVADCPFVRDDDTLEETG